VPTGGSDPLHGQNRVASVRLVRGGNSSIVITMLALCREGIDVWRRGGRGGIPIDIKL
jgi:hypothetical protein